MNALIGQVACQPTYPDHVRCKVQEEYARVMSNTNA